MDKKIIAGIIIVIAIVGIGVYSFANYVMFSTDSAYIIMNRSEAEKIPIMDQNEALDDATENDLYHYIIIKCDVLETHSMGSGLKDMILVNNVDFVRNETTTLN